MDISESSHSSHASGRARSTYIAVILQQRSAHVVRVGDEAVRVVDASPVPARQDLRQEINWEIMI